MRRAVSAVKFQRQRDKAIGDEGGNNSSMFAILTTQIQDNVWRVQNELRNGLLEKALPTRWTSTATNQVPCETGIVVTRREMQ